MPSIVKLGKHIKQVRGVSYSRDEAVSTIRLGYMPILRANNIVDGQLIFENLVYVPQERISGIQQIRKGDVVMAASSGSKEVVGKTAVAENDWQGGFGAFCKVIRPKESIDSIYLSYFFRSPHYRTIISNTVNGSNINNIRNEHIDELEVPFQSLAKQKQIAHILSQVDKARQQRKAAMALTEEFLQSTFLSLFGDPVRNEKGWEVKELETLYSKRKEGTKCGPFGSALKKHEYVCDGVPVWVMDNIVGHRFEPESCLYITHEKYNDLQSYSVEDNDIIISRAGTVGKMCVVESSFPKSIISTNLIRLSLDERRILPIFFVSLMSYFGSRVGKLRTGEDGAFTHMNTGILNKLEFPLPPLSLQQQFATIVAQTEALRQRQRAHAEELERLFQGLLQQYFGQ